MYNTTTQSRSPRPEPKVPFGLFCKTARKKKSSPERDTRQIVATEESSPNTRISHRIRNITTISTHACLPAMTSKAMGINWPVGPDCAKQLVTCQLITFLAPDPPPRRPPSSSLIFAYPSPSGLYKPYAPRTTCACAWQQVKHHHDTSHASSGPAA